MPAPLTSVKSIEKNAACFRENAIKVEAKYFARLAKTEVSGNLIALFLNEQQLSKRNAQMTKDSAALTHVAVIGAGIMGGGIAYQAAYKGKNVAMKDIQQHGLDQGLQEASKLLSKRVERGRLSVEKMAEVLSRIKATLHFAELEETQIAVEAVVEILDVKKSVLAEAESRLADNAILASNTSTLSITAMAEALKRPEQFCGMHFFNPVHKMPLVEVIRGAKTSDATIATTVKLAIEMGKTPIVVNDGPGFYVNRVLFPYLAAFDLLLRDGVDFHHIDKVMEKFGWPMGPAYLVDVVGIDTGCHAAAVMAEGFERMHSDETTSMQRLLAENRLGQKNGLGYYQYENDKKGRPVKKNDSDADAIVLKSVSQNIQVADDQIIQRLMIPMCFEVARCLEEGIVSYPVDADMGLLMGIGFPLFRGGPLRYMESIGIATFIEQAKAYQTLGGLYQVPDLLLGMAQRDSVFYPVSVKAEGQI
ncbi:MAG: hypothetical protein HRU20_31995 [Pseudomonadales bacterium]|nr:hypothetical protein [Pseudomonadales bacterium]